jgi:hypothetical protein
MASGQQLAEENFRKFAAWKQSKTDDDFRNMVVRGALSRKDIAAECVFAGSVLNQNPRVKKALQELEDELRARQVLPPKAGDAEADSPEAATALTPRESPARAARDAERLSRLEKENASLKAENGELKRLLSRYAVLQEVLAETGRLPR